LLLVVLVMGGSPVWSGTIAAPTTQSPADRAGQGGVRSCWPRFTPTPMLRLRMKSSAFYTSALRPWQSLSA